jgi:uncharacterized radical SAM superfamily Fe-S cluster-containing enzyme
MDVLHTTRALCPECMRVLPAQIGADERGKVWMVRSCPEHGTIETMIWPDAEHYRWMASLAFPKVLPRRDALHTTAKPCPTGCGICRHHQRKPTLVEIEVTQRCNLRCPVCFMSAEASYTDVPLERLSSFFETIARTAGVDTGVQITGGEPTVRDDLPQIIRMGREHGFWGVEVNTNGVVISRDGAYLKRLVTAGLTGIYLQFDGMSPETYRQIRGVDLLDVKLRAVERCREAGVQVVLAMTIVSGINSREIGAVIDFALENVDVVAGVALQPAFTSGRFDAKRVVPLTMGDVIFMLEEQTGGLICAHDIWPLGCSHPFCDTGTFLVPNVAFAAAPDVTSGAAPDVAFAATPGVTPGATLGAICAATSDVTSTAAPAAAPDVNSRNPNSNTAPDAASDASSDARAYPSITQNYIPVTRGLSRDEYLALYNSNSPQGSVFGDIVAKKRLSPERGLSVIIMNYMDAFSADLERMEECSMYVTMPDGRLIPFCSYQLTDCAGRRVHLPWGMPTDDTGAVRWDKGTNECVSGCANECVSERANGTKEGVA